MSLNSQLLQCPDLTDNLVGVLIRFREEPIAVMADIEGMFHQVCVSPKDCDALHFFLVTRKRFQQGSRRLPNAGSFIWSHVVPDLHEFWLKADGG